MRFRDFLRVAVLLFGGAATALAVVSVVGAARDEDRALLFIALGWWLAAAAIGLWLGRRLAPTPGIAGLLASARKSSSLPELEPGALGFFVPQVPAIATGYALLVALTWRRQSSAVAAIEGRDGVEFWFDRSSPFGPPKLLRLPGLRKIEPVPDEPREAARL